MATLRLALPQQLYSDVLGSLRQRRAAGKTVTKRHERSAWAAYWDAMARRQEDVRRLGMLEEQLKLQKKVAKHNMKLGDKGFALRAEIERKQIALQQAALALKRKIALQDLALRKQYYELQKQSTDQAQLERAREFNKQMELEERKLGISDKSASAAKQAGMIRGAMEIGGLGLTAASLLKGTKLGSKIGLGAPKSPIEKAVTDYYKTAKSLLGKPTLTTEPTTGAANLDLTGSTAQTSIPTISNATTVAEMTPSGTLASGPLAATQTAAAPSLTAPSIPAMSSPAIEALSAMAPLQSTASMAGGVGAGATGGFSGSLSGLAGPSLGSVAMMAAAPIAAITGLKALGLGNSKPYDPYVAVRHTFGGIPSAQEFSDWLSKLKGPISITDYGVLAHLGPEYAEPWYNFLSNMGTTKNVVPSIYDDGTSTWYLRNGRWTSGQGPDQIVGDIFGSDNTFDWR